MESTGVSTVSLNGLVHKGCSMVTSDDRVPSSGVTLRAIRSLEERKVRLRFLFCPCWSRAQAGDAYNEND